jgi:hypothetical protein
VAQFRVEFVLDEATGMYLAELYHPENDNEVVVRTEARYPTQAAAVLGVVQIFKDAILQFPTPKAMKKKPVRKKKVAPKKKAAPKKKKPARKAAKRRKHR